MDYFNICKKIISEGVETYECAFNENKLQKLNEELEQCFQREKASVPFKKLTLDDCYKIMNHKGDGWLTEPILFTRDFPSKKWNSYEYTSTVAKLVDEWITVEVYRNPDNHDEYNTDAYETTTIIEVVD